MRFICYPFAKRVVPSRKFYIL